MTRQTFRRFAAGLLGLVGLLGGCRTSLETRNFNNSGYSFSAEVSAENPGNTTIQRKKEKAEPTSGAYYTGYASASYATKFIRDGGIILGRGPVIQSRTYIERKDNLVVGDSILIGAFGNYDIRDGDLVEVDFNAELKRPVYFWENLVGGYDDPKHVDCAFLGYQFRQYPNRLFGTRENYDHVLNAGFLHSSRVDLKFDLLHLLPDVDTQEGDLFRFTGSKRIQVGKLFDERNFFIDPFVSTAYAYNWYGIDKFTAVTSGVDVSLEKNHSVIGGKIQCQSSLNPKVRDALYAGVEIGVRF